jgi:hypothetical protein
VGRNYVLVQIRFSNVEGVPYAMSTHLVTIILHRFCVADKEYALIFKAVFTNKVLEKYSHQKALN